MDHVLLCSDNLTYSPIEVPYLCNENFRYDDLGFSTYPERSGVDIALLAQDKFSILALADSAPFLQAWLWFGILGEGLDVGSHEAADLTIASSQVFIKTIGDQRYLCTNRLREFISKAKTSYENSLYGEMYRERLSLCIQSASVFIQTALETASFAAMASPDTLREQLHPVFKVFLACQILHQTLLDTLWIPSLPQLGDHGVLVPSRENSVKLVDRLLWQSGWCPKDIGRIPVHVSFRYHLSFYRQSSRSKETDHSRDGECDCVQEKDNKIFPVHAHTPCGCAHVGISSSIIEESILNGQVVLVRFRHDEGRSKVLEMKDIRLHSGRQPLPYVAISHVRSEGLGNETRNSLPACQLSILQSFVDQLGINALESTFFWIDTLCVPLKRHLRKVALDSVRTIFAQAHHVLVWDPPLYRHIFGTSEEALIRLRYSNWKRRVWTVREGFVAKSIVVRFADRLVSLDEIVRNFERPPEGDSFRLVILKQSAMWPSGLDDHRDFHHQLPDLMKLLADDVDAWSKDAPQTTILYSPRRDQLLLYKYLRLGYLSAYKFRYFVEDDECQQIRGVWRALLKTYGSERGHEAEVLVEDILEQVFRRLRHMLRAANEQFG